MTHRHPVKQSLELNSRRSTYIQLDPAQMDPLDSTLAGALEGFDLVYRTLCGILYNFAPNSGHPGGSISSGRIVSSLLFSGMDYDFLKPSADENDVLSYAAGHKAMGLYAMWALRNECVRIARPDLLPDENSQLRLEDLLGFRRNPVTDTPLFLKFKSKPLDGHPTPATPFIRLATGASGVGVASSFGLALGALDYFGADAPWVHVLEGEGGMTPGRVQESLASAATSRMKNVVMHLDWNQASIDSNRVCRENCDTGDYVQWTPAEMFYVNDWNVIFVPNGHDYHQVLEAQRIALGQNSGQPTAIVYRTTKGWKYGIEGKSSHGAGHAFCSEGFYKYLTEFEQKTGRQFPKFSGDKTPAHVEEYYFDTLQVLRSYLESPEGRKLITNPLGEQVAAARQRLHKKARKARQGAPDLTKVFDIDPNITPAELQLKPGENVTLRGVLGDVTNYLNKKSGGAILGSAADLLESTSMSHINKGFPAGFFDAVKNPGSRIISFGGICEDGMGGLMSGISAFGRHIGSGSSYGAFIAALQHVPARLHAIGSQMRQHAFGVPPNPFIIVCGHAGPKTGEDGPTHADPQPLQLLEENFPKGTVITLTPWCAKEMWPLMAAALRARPAVIAAFVTRPSEQVVDREKMRVPPASTAAQGLYALRQSKNAKGTIILQGNGVASTFVNEVLQPLDEQGIDLNVFYISSAELFDLLPDAEKERIYPESLAREAMGITEFTLPTMYRWVTSNEGRKRTLHPFRAGHFLGSGHASRVFQEAKLDGKSQFKAVMEYIESRKR
jgi:transketolase